MQLSKNNTIQFKVLRSRFKVYNLEPRTLNFEQSFGGGERVRTDDPLRARQVLSQLSYTPDYGGPGWTRTSDLTIISRVL